MPPEHPQLLSTQVSWNRMRLLLGSPDEAPSPAMVTAAADSAETITTTPTHARAVTAADFAQATSPADNTGCRWCRLCPAQVFHEVATSTSTDIIKSSSGNPKEELSNP